MKKALTAISIFVLALMLQTAGRATATTSSAQVDPLIARYLSTRALGTKMPVIITYRSTPTSTELGRLQAVGITKGFALRELPMVIADLNLAQVEAVKRQPGVRSVWANRVMKNFTSSSRRFIGVPQMMADGAVTRANTANPGMPISGKGVGIGYVDTGIDGTQEDLKFGFKTRQNVIQPLAQGVVSDAGLVLGVGISISDLVAGTGFVPPIYIENAPTSDLESGHGTHGAGVAAGTGANSGGFFGGVAAGAHLVGVDTGDDKGLPLVAILGAFDYMLVKQFDYNIRVVNNSWGDIYSAEAVSANDPVNISTRMMHDRNMTVVFAAGNDGSTDDAINPYSTMPWTISVAAGEKEGYGSPADFSSRGKNNGTDADVAGMPADETAQPNLRPDITAPGVAIISVRAHGASPLMAASGQLNGDAVNIPVAFQPNYLSSQGTSFACPHVSGVVALLMEADSTLTPDQVITILRETANPMPYEERVVGAGYVDAHNAVRRVLGLTAVAHTANLFPPENLEIVDLAGDNLGTAAQDIRSVDYYYDAAKSELVYTMEVTDLSARTVNNAWNISSVFVTDVNPTTGAVTSKTLFVSALTTETGGMAYSYGTISKLPNGSNSQDDIGAPTGTINGNQIVIRLTLKQINEALWGANTTKTALGHTSTSTSAIGQIVVGALGSGLLYPADTASGRDFVLQ
ncbi:MAG TPA: S8 family serine peptidase [Pyrinomonadaceae bacterium]|jgi:serine protease AprX